MLEVIGSFGCLKLLMVLGRVILGYIVGGGGGRMVNSWVSLVILFVVFYLF